MARLMRESVVLRAVSYRQLDSLSGANVETIPADLCEPNAADMQQPKGADV